MNFFSRRKSSFNQEFLEMIQAMALDDEGRKRLLELSDEKKGILLANHRKLGRPISPASTPQIPVDNELYLDLLSKQKLSPPEMKRHLEFTDLQKQEFIWKYSEKNSSKLSISNPNDPSFRPFSPTTTPKSTRSYKFGQNISLKSTKRNLKQLHLDMKNGDLKLYSDYTALENCIQKCSLKTSFYADNVNEYEIKGIVFEILSICNPDEICKHSILKELIGSLKYPCKESQYEILASHEIRKDYLKSFSLLFQLLSRVCFQTPRISQDIFIHCDSLISIQKEQFSLQKLMDLFKDPFGFSITPQNSPQYELVQIWEFRTSFVKFVNGIVSCSEEVDIRSKARTAVEQAGFWDAVQILRNTDQAPQEFLFQVKLYDEDRANDRGLVHGLGVDNELAEVVAENTNSNAQINQSDTPAARHSVGLSPSPSDPNEAFTLGKTLTADRHNSSANNLETSQLWQEIQRLQKLVGSLQDELAIKENYIAKNRSLHGQQLTSTESTNSPPIPSRKPLESGDGQETLQRESDDRIIESSMILKSSTSLKSFPWDLLTKNQLKMSIWNEVFTDAYNNPEEYLSNADQKFMENALAKEEVKVKVLPNQSQKVLFISQRHAQNIEIFMNANKLTPALLRDNFLSVDDKTLTLDILLRLKSLIPSPEILHKIATYEGNHDSLGKAEAFIIALISIPAYEARLEACIFRHQFTQGYAEMIPDFTILRSAIKEVTYSKSFRKILALVLVIGNFMNGVGFRGLQRGFKLCSLLYLKDMPVGDINLLHFIAKKVDVNCFLDEIGSIEQAKNISYKTLVKAVNDLSTKYEQIKLQVEAGGLQTGLENDNIQQLFEGFLQKASGRMEALKIICRKLKGEMHDFLVAFGETTVDEPESLFDIVFQFSQQLAKADMESSLIAPTSKDEVEEERTKGTFATMIEQNGRRLKPVDGEKPFSDRGMTLGRPLKFYDLPNLIEPAIDPIQQVIAMDKTLARARKTIKQLQNNDQ